MLRRFIDTVCYLADQVPFFHGNEGSTMSLNTGHFVKFLNVLKICGPLLENRVNPAIVILIVIKIISVRHFEQATGRYAQKIDAAFDIRNFLVSKFFVEIYNYSKLGPIRNLKEFVNIAELPFSRKDQYLQLKFLCSSRVHQ
jgi:hypothetical protein